MGPVSSGKHNILKSWLGGNTFSGQCWLKQSSALPAAAHIMPCFMLPQLLGSWVANSSTNPDGKWPWGKEGEGVSLQPDQFLHLVSNADVYALQQ